MNMTMLLSEKKGNLDSSIMVNGTMSFVQRHIAYITQARVQYGSISARLQFGCRHKATVRAP